MLGGGGVRKEFGVLCYGVGGRKTLRVIHGESWDWVLWGEQKDPRGVPLWLREGHMGCWGG